jgi:hypothetical protein
MFRSACRPRCRSRSRFPRSRSACPRPRRPRSPPTRRCLNRRCEGPRSARRRRGGGLPSRPGSPGPGTTCVAAGRSSMRGMLSGRAVEMSTAEMRAGCQVPRASRRRAWSPGPAQAARPAPRAKVLEATRTSAAVRRTGMATLRCGGSPTPRFRGGFQRRRLRCRRSREPGAASASPSSVREGASRPTDPRPVKATQGGDDEKNESQANHPGRVRHITCNNGTHLAPSCHPCLKNQFLRYSKS